MEAVAKSGSEPQERRRVGLKRVHRVENARKSVKKTSKNFEKGIDKPDGKWYNKKVAAEKRRTSHRENGRKPRKKVEKTLEKGVDKRERKWYNNKAVPKGAAMILEN